VATCQCHTMVLLVQPSDGAPSTSSVQWIYYDLVIFRVLRSGYKSDSFNLQFLVAGCSRVIERAWALTTDCSYMVMKR
jgi:hypothetical protein